MERRPARPHEPPAGVALTLIGDRSTEQNRRGWSLSHDSADGLAEPWRRMLATAPDAGDRAWAPASDRSSVDPGLQASVGPSAR
jgi:hypothetical protein